MTPYHKHLALIVCLMGMAPLKAALIRVPADQPTIQEAIGSASNGDTIVVYPGTYYENIFFRGKNIVVTSRFYESGDLNFVQSTIINGSQPVHADTASCVLFINKEDSTAVLQGFTITGGQGTKWKDEHSSGTYREGGGILAAFSSPIIRNNLIINNEAINKSGVTDAGGGGIRAGDGNPRILNNVIAYNKGQYGGSGVVLNWTGAIMRNNILAHNSGGHDDGGGALWVNNNGPAPKIIENNTFADNQLLAIFVWQGPVAIRNSIIWGNTPTSGSQIGKQSGVITLSYCDIQGGLSGTGNIAADPLFSNSSYQLNIVSPCIDAGDTASAENDPPNSSSPDVARWPALGTLRNDMGAYGGPGAGVFPAFGENTGIGFLKNPSPENLQLDQNYPNPFNPATTISYRIPENQFVTLKVYDVLGHEVETLVDETQTAGSHMIRLDGSKLASGVYFYRLQTEQTDAVKRLTLIK
jgi:hypothetical protein